MTMTQIETEEDELWGPDFREEKEQIKARGLRFMQWLMTRPESRIAVVSHSSFLFFTMANFGWHASSLVQVKISVALSSCYNTAATCWCLGYRAKT